MIPVKIVATTKKHATSSIYYGETSKKANSQGSPPQLPKKQDTSIHTEISQEVKLEQSSRQDVMENSESRSSESCPLNSSKEKTPLVLKNLWQKIL